MKVFTPESLSESRRTVVYAVVAALSVSLGFYTYVSNQPREMAEFEKVGEEFYPDFDRTDEATSLFVAKYYPDEGEVKTFEVGQVDGQWRIPSHYNYPADAAEQLARTAVSIMGVRREALISRRAADHEELGVVDPQSEDVSDRKGRGERITIKNGNEVLADFIIGKSYPGEEGAFYVRAPNEKETYVAKLDVDLSTKFQDWIDTDLLKIDRNKLVDIVVRKYSIDEANAQLKGFETVELTREKFGKPWELPSLDEETEEVNHDAVKDLASALVDLEILGVRPKPEGLTPDLEVSPDVSNPLAQAVMESELAQKGFRLAQMQGGGRVLLAQEGSFFATTNEGVNYELLFGNIFTGDLKEIEIGKTDDENESPDGKDASGEESGNSALSDETEAGSNPDSEQDEKARKSRYLFVKVSFEPSALGPEPAPPEPPQEPGPNAPLTAPRPGEPFLTPQEEFEQAQKEYESALKQYEQEQKSYEEKREAGQEKVAELRERLGAWYYVVPAQDVEALRVSRADLVQPKGTDAAEEAAQQPPPGARSPQLPFTPQQLQNSDQN